ncbi:MULTISPECIES: tol-pal system-associated acyl-CoA thioesterase [Burkholderia]|uniref:tol-pal system-associated acyl-CoA thioesterase n=1 Tax=Burkholderia TaxID=32008 RepID=UPI000841FE2C|nr:MULTISPECIES: tol-pal system-associated acyl-CoA thioesterase [unclassified Burkholderia]AOK28912.1 4-hydroxybenzoyl-CoA thioesterase [Burkholderia sp. Bp7605]
MRAMIEPTQQPDAAPDFVWPVRVYYEDTDTGGVVYYANYLKFFERARTEWLRACGVDQRRVADETGAIFVVCDAALNYRAPARLDDALTITCKIDRLGHASVTFTQQAWRDDMLLVTAKVRIACVDRTVFRSSLIPPPVFEALKRGPAARGLRGGGVNAERPGAV